MKFVSVELEEVSTCLICNKATTCLYIQVRSENTMYFSRTCADCLIAEGKVRSFND